MAAARDPDPRTPDAATDEAIASLAKGLAHPARVRIVRLLLARDTCIGGDIVDEVGLAQSTVSEHLRILKTAGLVTGEIERPRICYSLNPDCLEPLARLLDEIRKQPSPDRCSR
ncbi:MAG TPA: metalloregulator ArsR/SmtB family transcription factor [Woeseiaceae bacterium]|nr:metalloregulator ArsR/SmtB family transcription factor [Woeseiaceae bacterium]